MPGGKTNDHRVRGLAKDFGRVDYTPPTIWYVALFTSMPVSGGYNWQIELGYNGYARVPIANDPSEWNITPTGQCSNVNAITFDTNAGPSEPVAVAFGLMDDANNLWRYGPVSPVKTLLVNKAPTWPAGSLIITES
jgi:hypothetical protein